MNVSDASKLMNKSKQFVRLGLQRGVLPFGVAVKTSSKWTYWINEKKFYEYIGRTEN